MRKSLIAMLCAPLALSSAVAAQNLDVPDPIAGGAQQMTLELNNVLDTEDGACQLTVVTTNRLETGLKRAAWQVAIFDAAGVVQALPVLDFGSMIAGKTKVAVFRLAGQSCKGIGRIVVNDVAECLSDDGTDMREACLGGLSITSRTDVEFGL